MPQNNSEFIHNFFEVSKCFTSLKSAIEASLQTIFFQVAWGFLLLISLNYF